MQLANAFVALDKNNLVPKYGITAAEIAVLRAIHGPDSVMDIEPAGEVDRSNTEELGRLRDVYGAAHDDDNQPVLRSVFPVPSSITQTLEDLELDASLFKPTKRAKPSDKASTDAKQRAEDGADAHSAIDGKDDAKDDKTPATAKQPTGDVRDTKKPAKADAFD